MHIVFALPEPAQSGGGGGSDYVGGLAPALRALGHQVDVLTTAIPALPQGTVLVVDGMRLPDLQERLDELAATGAVALVHHIAAAAGRDDGARENVLAIERIMLPRMRRVIATSQPVADRLSGEFDLPASAVMPGARDLPRAGPDPDRPLILAIGVLTRRKRHDLLLQAVARLTDLPWRLVIAGDANREPEHARALAAAIQSLGLAERVELWANPAPATLEAAWSAASVFALASRWEGYPAAAAEALRRGIPTVVTDTGAAGTLIPLEAGAVCPVDDMATFGKCLRRLLSDHALRTDMAEAAWRVGQDLPSWQARAQDFVALLES